MTAAVVVLALLAGWWMWRHYEVEPWTRDGRVRADVVQLAPDVSGVVTSVEVRDNQRVTRGQVLFVIDRARFELALRQAEAATQGALAQFDRVVLNALLETEGNLTQYTQDLERVVALTAARDFSAQAAREADALYRGGREDFLTVLDAERTRANAEASLASAQTRLVADQISLFLSFGGGWEEPPPARGQ